MGYHRDVRQVAGHEGHDLLDTDEVGEGLLQNLVARPLATDEARRQRPETGRVKRGGRGRFDGRMIAQPEIIVIGERDEVLAPSFGFGADLVDGDEKGIVVGDKVKAGKTKTLVGEVGEALLFLHALSQSRLRRRRALVGEHGGVISRGNSR